MDYKVIKESHDVYVNAKNDLCGVCIAYLCEVMDKMAYIDLKDCTHPISIFGASFSFRSIYTKDNDIVVEIDNGFTKSITELKADDLFAICDYVNDLIS